MDSKAQTCRPHQQSKIRMERYWGQDKGISSSGAIWYFLPATTAEKGTPGVSSFCVQPPSLDPRPQSYYYQVGARNDSENKRKEGVCVLTSHHGFGPGDLHQTG